MKNTQIDIDLKCFLVHDSCISNGNSIEQTRNMTDLKTIETTLVIALFSCFGLYRISV